MAPRKSRSQPTGIIDVVKDIVSPWLGAPPTQNKSVTQAQGLARGAANILDQTFAGGMIGAGVKGNKALAKQAAVNAAALGAGYVAGKVVQTAASAVAKTGVVRQIVNKVNPPINSYYTHGGPALQGGVLDPVYGRGAPKFDYTKNPNSAIAKRAQYGENREFIASYADDVAIQKLVRDSPLSIKALRARNINKFITKGEKHHTVINSANTQRSVNYAKSIPIERDAAGKLLPDTGGFVHVFKIPQKFRRPSTGGLGEVNVWGKQKPIASFPLVPSRNLDHVKVIDDFIANQIKKNKRR